ncbi:MAG: secretin N-terminal domain-containing protein, partial [Pseudomonadota bacterium]
MHRRGYGPIAAVCTALTLSACQSPSLRDNDVRAQIGAEMSAAKEARVKPAQPDVVTQALIPPMTVLMPGPSTLVEQRFDLAVNNAPAAQVFNALVSGTRYSMLVHPDIKDPISINLKNVTMLEALDSMRELYGYEFKIDSTRIYILPVTLQSRLFQVNYLAGRRVGRAEVRVSSGSIQAPVASAGPPGAGGAASAQSGGQTASLSTESSRITTSS